MKRTYDKLKRFFQDFYLVLVLIFLYAPIVVMMVLSFNSSKSRSQWGGFTTQWYKEMFQSPVIIFLSLVVEHLFWRSQSFSLMVAL